MTEGCITHGRYTRVSDTSQNKCVENGLDFVVVANDNLLPERYLLSSLFLLIVYLVSDAAQPWPTVVHGGRFKNL